MMMIMMLFQTKSAFFKVRISSEAVIGVKKKCIIGMCQNPHEVCLCKILGENVRSLLSYGVKCFVLSLWENLRIPT